MIAVPAPVARAGRSAESLPPVPREGLAAAELCAIAQLAAMACNAGTALITLEDAHGKWSLFDPHDAMPGSARDRAFHDVAFGDPEAMLVVDDMLLDHRFAKLSILHHHPDMRSCVAVPVIDDSGERKGSISILGMQPFPVNDHLITALRTLARQVADLLALRVHREQVKEYERVLEERNAEMRRFVDVFGHDLREPLRMVSSFMERLRLRLGAGLDDKALQYMHLAQDGAARMTLMVDALLDYALLANHVVEPKPVDLRAVFDAVRLDLAPQLASCSGELVSQGGPPIVLGDKALLTRLFTYLVGNSIKFATPGVAPLIMVEAERSGKGWEIRVQDNGVGIAVNQQERIFELFSRMQRERNIPGTGMGLPICRKIMECHGGELWVDSEPGRGCTFHISLPFPSGT